MERAIHFNFGLSYRLALPVSQLILERLPATTELVLTSAVLSLVIGLPLGVYTGIRPHGFLSRAIMAGSLVGVSLPTFLLGILLILFFAVLLGWLPSFGRGDVVNFSHWSTGFLTLSGLRSLILPAITLGLFQMTLIMRLVRTEMLEVLRSDYIKFARARGLTPRAIYFGHALRNTLVPVITIVGLQIGGLIGFSIVTETVFQWPGMGLLLVQSIQNADIPVMSAYLLLIAVLFVVINLVVDILYYVVDPRLRVGR
jgi:peptide/nickel transport system permease protein